MRLRYLSPAIAGIVGAAVAVLPTLAAGSSSASSASFTATDFAWNVSGSSSTQATIPQGGTVSFSYPSGASQHNADFGSGPQPSSCAQTAGASSGAVPPLPHSPTAPGWTGSCTFNTPGTYTFHCDLHPFMTATIVVQGSGVTTTTTTPSTTTTTPSPPPPTTATTTPSPPTTTTGSPPPGQGAGGSPLAGVAAKAVAIAASQRGTAVRGSVDVSAAGAGGRLEVDLFAARRALTGARGPVRVGRLVRTSVHAGIVRFSVALDRAARRALARHRRLALTVTVTVASPRGVRAATTRRVVLHARR